MAIALTTNQHRLAIFWLQVFYLFVLAALAWAYQTDNLWPFLAAIPDPVGPIPLAVPWFGALGGTLISLAGVHQHRYTWDVRFWSWHFLRPVVGAAVAVVAVMIVQAGILATGLELEANGDHGTFYYLVAWIAGYREATFRSMVQRLADVILASPEDGLPPRITAIEPPAQTAGQTVTIKGVALTGTEAVTFGTTSSPTVRVLSDTAVEAEVPTPPAGAGQVSVGVTTPRGSSSIANAFTHQ